MMNRCAILGSSGLVSQTIQYLLENHPWFELVQVAGSEEKVGMQTSSFEWRLPYERPRNDFTISSLNDVKDVEIVFSALPSDIAAIWEKNLAKDGMNVFSNAPHFVESLAFQCSFLRWMILGLKATKTMLVQPIVP